jgi:4-fold beta-flower domain-containing protein
MPFKETLTGNPETAGLIDFYDQSGHAVAYSDDGQHIYLFTGEAVSFIDSDAVYSYRGEQLGWFEKGWIRDKDGRCIAFSDRAVEGPHRPSKRAKPEKAVRQPRPSKEATDPRALRPIHSNAWSAQSAKDFFSRLPRGWPGPRH